MDLAIVERALSSLGGSLHDFSRLILIRAEALANAHVPPFPPEFPILITEIRSAEHASHLTTILRAVYPPNHQIYWVDEQQAQPGRLSDPIPSFGQQSLCCYLPPLLPGTSFEAFLEIVAHLRAPDGCPWDRQQTHASLRTHLLQEAYEALEAIDADDAEAMQEEFGDLLLQIVLQSQIASEAERFSITNVIQGIYNKIVRRHPHVFGDTLIDGVQGVLHNWERLKEQERNQSQAEKKRSEGLLDGVPRSLPALTQAQEYQDRAARVGFDWSHIEGVLQKLQEEIEEMKNAPSPEQAAAEFGDLLFALVNLARWKRIDAESALRQANLRFKKRFAYIEEAAREQGRTLPNMTLAEMDALWEEAKQNEHADS